MCGISGIITKNGSPVDHSIIQSMNDLVAHRGPDGEGLYIESAVALGHRRLAIIDLTEHGHQPMRYGDRYTIVYNGEVYNYLELREELLTAGYRFTTGTDTEVILASYARWGSDCVHRFNGMWAFALYDAEKKIIFCSRDRFGIKPFYYYEDETRFAFASEIKQFTVLEGWAPRLNRPRALDFLVHGIFDHTDQTLFEGVRQLPGGFNLVYALAGNSYSIGRWYNLRLRKKRDNTDYSLAKEQFRDLFVDSIKLRLRSDVKVGSCLSGGLDSSAIVCVVNDLLRENDAHGKQETVSSCFTDKRYDEQEFIDAVIGRTGAVSHRVFPDYGDLFAELDRIVWHQDEPFGSTSIFAQWSVFKTAREKGIVVMLDGQGADEQLAGYHYTFYGAFFKRMLMHLQWWRLVREMASFRALHGYSSVYLLKVIAGALLPSWTVRFLKKIIGSKRPSLVASGKPWVLETSWKTPPGDIAEESLNELLYTSLPMLLHYEDRDSMAHSVESRVPFLDYRLVEFLMKLPDHYKIREGKTKYILREALKDDMPGKIITRYDKMGFVTPEEAWLRENSADFRKELEQTVDMAKGLINTRILNIFDEVVKGNHSFDFIIWRYIVFGRWLRVFKIVID